jgi:hypothetical protein
MSTQAIIMIVLLAIEVGIALAKDGQPKTGRYSFWWTSVNVVTICCILYAGGFFSKVAP